MRDSAYVVESSATATGSATVVSVDSSDTYPDDDDIPSFKEIMCSSKRFPSFESARFLQRVFLCLIVFTLALVGLSVFGGIWSRKTVLDAADNSVSVEFASLSFSVSQVVQETLLTAVNVLGVLGASMSVRRAPDYQEFLHLSATIRASIRNPIVQWAPRILHAERSAWESTISASLGVSAQIIQFGSPSSVSPPRSEYYPISYLDPLAGNTAVVLLDMLSHPTRQAFVTTARDTATPQVTSPVALLQFTELPLGCVVITPVYNITCGNVASADASTRQECILGVVMGVFRFSVLLESFLETFQGQHVAVTMSDNGTTVFVGSTERSGDSRVTVYPTNHTLPTSDRVATYSIPVANRVYVVSVIALPGFGDKLTSDSKNGDLILVLIVSLGMLIVVLGWMSGVMYYLHDRQQRMSAIAQKKASAAELQASQDAHNRIVGYVCHELRNPLHVVETSCNLLAAEAPASPMSGGERGQLVKDLKNALEQMRCTVDDVLDFKAIQLGGLSFKPRLVRVSSALSGVVKRTQRYLQGNITFRYRLPRDSEWAYLDTIRINQIITNGASNAGKFTPSGCVTVLIDLRFYAGHRYLIIDVMNTGSGLPGGSVDKLFIPFKGQGSASETWAAFTATEAHKRMCRSLWLEALAESENSTFTSIVTPPEISHAPTASTGLGLPLARAFANLCGGWLSLEDDDAGTTHFWCVVKAPEATPTDMQAIQLRRGTSVASHEYKESSAPTDPADRNSLDTTGMTVVMSDLRIAVVEDDPPLRRAALRLLKRLGVQESNVTFLCDGEAGLNYIQDRRNRPHVVLMDINMPKILGTEVMRQCGKQPYPIIAATGNVDPDSIAQYEALGFAGVLSKPFTGNDLKRALMKAVTIGDLNLLPAIADSEPVSDAVVSLVDSNFSNSGPGSSLVFENASSARSLPKDDSHSDG